MKKSIISSIICTEYHYKEQKHTDMPFVSVCVCVYMHVCVQQRPDEEVVVDQGGTSSVMNIHYEKEELEGEYRVKHYSKGHSGAT